jgi:hypothetical protein
MLADALDAEDIPVAVASDEEALKLPPHDAPQLVITGINRGHNEDLTGSKWSRLCGANGRSSAPSILPRCGRCACAVTRWRRASGFSRNRFAWRR